MKQTEMASGNVSISTRNLEDHYYIYCNSTTCTDIELDLDPYLYPQYQAAQVPIEFDFSSLLYFRCFMSWLSLVVIFIGLVGNLISFIILIHPKMRISTNVFLSSLCVSGFIALLGLLANSVIYDLLAYYGYLAALGYLSLLYPYVYPIITTFQMYSILLTVCVSLNQFIYIYFSGTKQPNQKKSEKDCRKALKIVLLMFLMSSLFCVPYWLKFKYTREQGLHETELGKNPLFNRIVHFWMYLPIAYFIPLTILIITNVYLIGTIMLARRRRQRLGMTGTSSSVNHHTQQQSQQQSLIGKKQDDKLRRQISNPDRRNGRSGGMNITIMLIAVVFLFFCCQCPVLCLHIIQSMFCMDASDTDRYRCKTSMMFMYAQVVAKFLLICNLSFNFACYCLFNQKFRQVFRETLGLACFKNEPADV